MRACIKIIIKTRWEIEFVETIRATFGGAETSPDYVDNRRERKRGRERYASYVAPGINPVPRLRYLSAESKLIFQIEDGAAVRCVGFFLFPPIRDSIYRAILSRPNVSRGGVRRPVWTLLALIHWSTDGTSRRARCSCTRCTRHNAHAYPLSLLRRIIGHTFNDTRNVGRINRLFTETNRVAVYFIKCVCEWERC